MEQDLEMAEKPPKHKRNVTTTTPAHDWDIDITVILAGTSEHDITMTGHHPDITVLGQDTRSGYAEISPGQDRDMVETSTRQHQNITGTRPGFHRDMPGWIFSRCMRRGRPPYPWKTPNLSFLRNKKTPILSHCTPCFSKSCCSFEQKTQAKKDNFE